MWKGGNILKILTKLMIWYMTIAMLVIGSIPRALADLSPSEVIAFSQTDKSQDIQKLQKFLETKMIRERLREFGFTPDEIKAKLNSLNDQQIHQVALHLDEMEVGGDGVEIVIVVLLIAVLVALIIYATGHRIILK